MLNNQNAKTGFFIAFFTWVFYTIFSSFLKVKPIELLNTSILFGTALVIIWYTYETNRLREETIKQTELSILPCLALEEIDELTLTIRNIGNGAALNIGFSTNIEGFSFDSVTVLSPNEKTVIHTNKPSIAIKEFQNSMNTFSFLTKVIKEKNAEISIFYCDVANQMYSQTLLIKGTGIYIGAVRKGIFHKKNMLVTELTVVLAGFLAAWLCTRYAYLFYATLGLCLLFAAGMAIYLLIKWRQLSAPDRQQGVFALVGWVVMAISVIHC